MPANESKSLTDDKVYAVIAYVLHLNGVIGQNDTMNARTLSKVRMPNRDGFMTFYWASPLLFQRSRETWVNASNVNIRQDGRKVDVFGSSGTGLAIFAGNGGFAMININPNTPKFAPNNRGQGTAAENKAVVLEGIGLFGTHAVFDHVTVPRGQV